MQRRSGPGQKKRTSFWRKFVSTISHDLACFLESKTGLQKGSSQVGSNLKCLGKKLDFLPLGYKVFL
jgi:hypothetical protein